MLTRIVVSIVKACTRFAATTVLIALVFAIAAGFYTARHFEINTDINTLISPELDWRKRDIQFDDAFDRDRTILAVVEAPTPELTSSASAALHQKLAGDTKHFESIEPLGSGEFFEKNGLLFLPAADVARFTSQFESAAPLIEILAG
ncbi:MAG TPA: hopanoid biosynthesis-associated RND transporter HpnN, partial [Bradyrhizobium sp.]|nr:hopanoid biosynthesis-associated RND transporter HpnN [Bradyrhizobium sp.]